MNAIPEWVKVKAAALLGVGTPVAISLFEKLGPALDTLIKLGQVGVAAVTILYILSKWRKVRGTRNRKDKQGPAGS